MDEITELKAHILLLEQKLELEQDRADRNYNAAVHFEELYDAAIEWAMSLEVE